MIINTGSRTDIPACYSQWFYNRIREGYVLTRNPYYPQQVTRYRLEPEVVDCLVFCTKNPAPMLERLDEIRQFGQFWGVTATPYGKEIEPNVPEKDRVLESVRRLSERVGVRAVNWRYDPIFISDRYSVDFHIDAFLHMAEVLEGASERCVVSFIDLYEKTKKNFPGVREVTAEEQEALVSAFVEIGGRHGIQICTCCENPALSRLGADVSGCMTKPVIERAIGCTLDVPGGKGRAREQCGCLLGADIGAYNTCDHACVYCYANYDRRTVAENRRRHDPDSPFLIGGSRGDDIVREAKQVSWRDGQLSLF